VAYTQYSANISSFLFAAAKKRTITISPAPLGLLPNVISFPIDPPTVSFTLLKPLNTDQSDKFLTLLGTGASKTQSGRTTIYHAHTLSTDMTHKIVQLSTPFFNAGRDAINPRGLLAYKLITTWLKHFSQVHAYPAFHRDDTDSITLFEQLVSGPAGGDYYAREYVVKDEKGVESSKTRDLSDKAYTLNEYKKRPRDAEEMDGAEEEPMAKIAAQSVGFVQFRGIETVFKARPPKHAAVNIGGSSEVPKVPGHVFPYFRGLIQPDSVFMNSIVLRRFYQLMGSTHQECQTTYLDVRHGINSLATTDRGMELCHMLLGVDLALETQTRCFIIIEKKQYLGFCLLGAKYAIFCNTRWIAPASEEDLQLAIARMDPHESAIEDMIARLEIVREKELFDRSVDRSVFVEPQTLVDALASLNVKDLDDEDARELDRCVRNLNYMGSGYLTKNPQMIAEMLETLAMNKPIVLERPTYLPSIRAPFQSRVFAMLSRFGPDAPSFWNDRGQEITCKSIDKTVASSGGKRKIGSEDVFGNMPEKILITPKPLLIAVQDMEKVIDKGKVKMDTKERAARYRNISVEHEESRKRIWKGLVMVCGETEKKKLKPEEAGSSKSVIDFDQLLHDLLG